MLLSFAAIVSTLLFWFVFLSAVQPFKLITILDINRAFLSLMKSASSVCMQTECIARISPKDGKVIGWLLMHGLRRSLQDAGFKRIDVLNGIAWDNMTARLFVTGKLWPKVFEIRMIDQTSDPDTNMEKVRKSCIR
jgi:uncharacterized protein YhhL (DUF1145 family)